MHHRPPGRECQVLKTLHFQAAQRASESLLEGGRMTVPVLRKIGFFRHFLRYLYHKKGGRYVQEIYSR